jgi:hypothetical protein
MFTENTYLHTQFDLDRMCQIWWGKYFGVFRCVAKKCLNHCYKIVVAHRGFDEERKQYRQLNVREVMEIHDLQVRLGFTAKVGMDSRDYTPTIWGAYWYFNDKRSAWANYKDIKEAVQKINPEIQVNVKRSCTEFELYLGPSHEWDGRDFGWEETEKALDEWVSTIPNFSTTKQFYLIQQSVKIRFLHWAYMHGDMTYKEFIDGDDLVYEFEGFDKRKIKPSVTYNPPE